MEIVSLESDQLPKVQTPANGANLSGLSQRRTNQIVRLIFLPVTEEKHGNTGWILFCEDR